MKLPRPLYRFLDTTGDGTGTKDAAVNGSVTPQVFKYVPVSGDKTNIHRMVVHYEDTGAFAPNTYGVITALTNGIQIQILRQEDDSLYIDLCDGIDVKVNHHWGRLCYDMNINDFGIGQATESMNVRWTFAKSGSPLYLQDAHYFAVTINDDLTGLDEQHFMIQGVIT